MRRGGRKYGELGSSGEGRVCVCGVATLRAAVFRFFVELFEIAGS